MDRNSILSINSNITDNITGKIISCKKNSVRNGALKKNQILMEYSYRDFLCRTA